MVIMIMIMTINDRLSTIIDDDCDYDDDDRWSMIDDWRLSLNMMMIIIMIMMIDDDDDDDDVWLITNLHCVLNCSGLQYIVLSSWLNTFPASHQ